MPKHHTVAVAYPLSDLSRHHLQEAQQVAATHGHHLEFREFEPNDAESALMAGEIFCGHVKVPVDWSRVVQGPLRWIQSSAAGLDHCLVDEVVDSAVTVTSCSGLFSWQVSETAMALLLGLTRRLYQFVPAFARRDFQRLPTDDLRGKHIGILGLGGNGQRIAPLCAALGGRVMACDYYSDWQPSRFAASPELDPASYLSAPIFAPDEFQGMVAESEILIVTVGLTPATRKMISADTLQRMPPGSYLVNVGRGEVVDQPALVDALTSGHLRAAGLDVAAEEPPPPASSLWELENLLLTPHVGAQSASRYEDVSRLLAENLLRWVQGLPLINSVDKSLGFPCQTDRLPNNF